MNVRELLKEGTELLSNRENALLDCEILLAYVLGVNNDYLISHVDEDVEESLVELFNQYINRVKEGEPVAYIAGEKEFYGLDFFVDNRVLIPRPETEQLVDRVLDYLKEIDETGREFRVLDVGTGSGNIAVSITKNWDQRGNSIVSIDAVDVDEDALEVAKVNVEQYGMEDRIRVYQSDLLDVLDEGESYDVIVANLPYIGEVKNRFISAEAEKYEPKDALFGGEDGLALYKKMFQQIVDKGINFGLLIGEFGFAQRKDMEDLLNKYFEQKWTIEKDLSGIDRIFIVKK